MDTDCGSRRDNPSEPESTAVLNRLAFVVIVLAAVTYEGVSLFTPMSTLRAIGTRPYVLNDLSTGVPVGQTMRSPDDGFAAVDVEFVSDRPIDLDLTWRVLGWAPNKLDDHWVVIYEFPATIHVRGRTW